MSAADLPSRRQVLTGRVIPPAPPEAHISSLVIHVRPEKAAAARAAITAMPGLEIHAEAVGKMIVTLETANGDEILERIDAISLLDGVMSTAMVFHHFEPAQPDEATTKEG